LCAFDSSFAAGLLEAAVQATLQDCPVTLIAYDVPYPEPLHAVRPLDCMFSVALVLAPQRSERALADVTIAVVDAIASATSMADFQLERLRLGNPAARSLPLLAAVARCDVGTIHLDGVDIAVRPA
jgi:hypothetical protein